MTQYVKKQLYRIPKQDDWMRQYNIYTICTELYYNLSTYSQYSANVGTITTNTGWP